MVSDHTLTIEYGANGVCLYRGHVISGTHTVSIARNEDAEVIVDHTWEGLSNGKFQLDGTATVTWNKADPSRHVEHELTWTRLRDGRTGTGRGDRIQRPLAEGGIAEGFSENGERTWDGRRGHWTLAIDQLEMHWTDPVPRSGSLTLDTPFDKTITMEFSEVDADTIHVELEGPNRSIGVDVNSVGQ